GRDILLALAGRVTPAQRALVLDAALDLVEHDFGTSVSDGLVVVAPHLGFADAPDVEPVWRRAVGLARDASDAFDRVRALTALAASPGVPARERQELLADAVDAAHSIEERDLSDRAVALARLASQLP